MWRNYFYKFIHSVHFAAFWKKIDNIKCIYINFQRIFSGLASQCTCCPPFLHLALKRKYWWKNAQKHVFFQILLRFSVIYWIFSVHCVHCTVYSSSQAFKKEMAGEIYVVSVDETWDRAWHGPKLHPSWVQP